jgi:hypothetical protein
MPVLVSVPVKYLAVSILSHAYGTLPVSPLAIDRHRGFKYYELKYYQLVLD